MIQNISTMLKRIPVVYKGKPLTPCTISRSYQIVKQGRGIFVKDKIFGWYLKLKKKGSRTRKTPKMVLGIDTGTLFLGFSVVSKTWNFNFEVEQTQKFSDTNYIKDKSEQRRMYRRNRRSRLRHRKIRFSNRIGHKVCSTTNYYHQNIWNFTKRICKFYPIKFVVIEDVSFHHGVDNPNYKKGSSFSPLEVGKLRLYEGIMKIIPSVYISKNNPKEIRAYLPLRKRSLKNIIDSDYVDLKTKNKAKKSFKAHCIDSFCLACTLFDERFNFNPEMLYIKRSHPEFDNIRRILSEFRKNPKNSKERHLSKLRTLRIKTDKEKSNHCKNWKYLSNDKLRRKTYSMITRIYGSSIYLSTQGKKKNAKGKEYPPHKKGEFKYLDKKLGFIYYEILNIKPPKVLVNVSYYFSNKISYRSGLKTLERYKKDKQKLSKTIHY